MSFFLIKLEALNLVINKGEIIDAILVEVSWGRNTLEGNKEKSKNPFDSRLMRNLYTFGEKLVSV